jgi:hypothetical protein
MPQRLTERFRLDEPVEVYFADNAAGQWVPGRIVALQHPGVWVQTSDARIWFVTNGKHIRKLPNLPHVT